MRSAMPTTRRDQWVPASDVESWCESLMGRKMWDASASGGRTPLRSRGAVVVRRDCGVRWLGIVTGVGFEELHHGGS